VIAPFCGGALVRSVEDMENFHHIAPHWLLRALGAIGGVLAVYLVGRGIAEFFIVNYSDAASYHNDWGGPSLAGVFAVHSGPAVAVLAGAAVYLRRRLRAHRVASQVS
jgi:hypothetical protein